MKVLTLESERMEAKNKKLLMITRSRTWLRKAAPFALIALIAFALGMRASNLDLFITRSNQNKDLPAQLDYSSVNQVYQELKKNFDGKLTEQQLIDGMKKGLVQATGDPYTVYFNAKDSSDFQNSLEGKFSGVGIELGARNNQLVVISALDGDPAQKAGVKAGDIIAKVNGQDTTGWSTDQAATKIQGKKGTKVVLDIIRNNQPLTFTLTRDDLTVPSVTSKVQDGVGYLQISRFSDDTSKLARQAAQSFADQHVKGVVLDLRGDGGGYLNAAVDVASLWLDNQVVVQERQGTKVVDTMHSGNDPILKGLPTAVLIDGGSASASEIVSGALQDHNAAKLIGVKSFGKGSVQQLLQLPGGGELKVTVARWYTPNGKNIDKQGITPDINVKLTDADTNAGRDPQKDRAFDFINSGH
jgi:carboxyl-terminal processing protease